MRTALTLMAFLVAVALVGCGGSPRIDYGKLDLADVSGTVTMDGEPLPNALVIFESPNMQFSSGETDSNGRYSLMLDWQQKGVTAGPKTVRIKTGASGNDDSGRPKTLETVPKRYNVDSELKVEVASGGGSQTFDFDLTSEGDVAQPKKEGGE